MKATTSGPDGSMRWPPPTSAVRAWGSAAAIAWFALAEGGRRVGRRHQQHGLPDGGERGRIELQPAAV